MLALALVFVVSLQPPTGTDDAALAVAEAAAEREGEGLPPLETVDCAAPQNMLEINDCRAAEVEASRALMQRYLDAGRARITADAESSGEDGSATLTAFDAAQTTWEAYATADCDAVYQNWIGGTIRVVMALDCQDRHYRDRTRVLWSQWLTFGDDTPPILPEPERTPQS